MTRTQLILLAAGGSLAVLLGAYGFQAMGYAPCQMCLWQRYPHMTAVVIGLLALAIQGGFMGRILPWLGALAALTTGGIGMLHTGVERHWWEGITSCSGAGDLSGLSGLDLLDTSRDLGPPLVKCDEIVWQFLSLTMANWNVLISAALAVLWIMAARRAT